MGLRQDNQIWKPSKKSKNLLCFVSTRRPHQGRHRRQRKGRNTDALWFLTALSTDADLRAAFVSFGKSKTVSRSAEIECWYDFPLENEHPGNLYLWPYFPFFYISDTSPLWVVTLGSVACATTWQNSCTCLIRPEISTLQYVTAALADRTVGTARRNGSLDCFSLGALLNVSGIYILESLLDIQHSKQFVVVITDRRKGDQGHIFILDKRHKHRSYVPRAQGGEV